MNKRELIEATHKEMCRDSGYDKITAERAVEGLLKTIERTLANGEKVSITGFGTFEAVQKKATTARNPRTGETVQVPAKTVPKFKAGKQLKEIVNS